MPRICEFRDLGRMGYEEAYALQRELVAARKAGSISDQLLFVEHPHTVTLGRNAKLENILASPELLSRAGIAVAETDRGGDVTYHGPGQLVGYPIFDLKEWHRDAGAYLRAIEEAIIHAIAVFGLHGERDPQATGVWVNGAKVAAIGIHLSRWVSSHGFALNIDTDLNYFRYIVPCGLTKPVASLRSLGVDAPADAVKRAVLTALEEVFDLERTGQLEATPRASSVVRGQSKRTGQPEATPKASSVVRDHSINLEMAHLAQLTEQR